jgi:hypothetical protein
VHHADAFVNSLGMSVCPPRLTASTEAPMLDIPGCSFDAERLLARFEAEWSNMNELFH